MNDMKSSDIELRLINLDLSDLNLFMFIAHVSSICFSASAFTPAPGIYHTYFINMSFNVLHRGLWWKRLNITYQLFCCFEQAIVSYSFITQTPQNMAIHLKPKAISSILPSRAERKINNDLDTSNYRVKTKLLFNYFSERFRTL